MAAYRYITKNISMKGATKVIYLPKEWGIKPGKDVTILLWTAGDEMPDDPYKLTLTVRDMNNNGAVGVYIPKTYVGDIADHKEISMCVITGDENGDA